MPAIHLGIARLHMLTLTVPLTLLLFAIWRRTGVLAALLLLAIFVVGG